MTKRDVPHSSTWELGTSEKRLRALVTASSYVIYRMSPDWSEMHELDGKGFLADTNRPSATWLQEYIPEPDQPHVLKAIRNAIRTKSMFELEHRVRRADGTLGWTHSRAVPLVDKNGEIAEWFGAARDVTPRKRAEAETLAIMDVAPVAIYVARDPQCLEIIGNHMANAHLQSPRGANLSKSAHEDLRPCNFRILKDSIEIPPHELPIQKAAATGQAIYNCELEVLYEDGASRDVIGNAAPLLGDDGQPLGAVGAFLDITDRKRIEDKLKQEGRFKDEFLGRLGHELRNPLTALSFATSMLLSATSEERVSLVETIDREVKLLQCLVDDLLDVARTEFGTIALREDSIDLSDFLQRMSTISQMFLAERRQEMILGFPPEPVHFVADQARLEQVAYNLLHNASKYTGQGGRIEFSGAREGSDVVIRCKDNGAGIPLEMKDMIFEKFVRVDMDGDGCAGGGLGIGLTMVKQLIELHGGAVYVESGGLGTGSEFVAQFPFKIARSTPRVVGPADMLAPRCRSLSIMVVEDDHYVGQTMRLALEKAGHSVSLFRDGPSALAGLSGFKPDAAIIDIGLPRIDGYELADKVRSMPDFWRMPMIAISGRDIRENRKVHEIFDQCLLKPISVAELLAVVENHVADRQQGTA